MGMALVAYVNREERRIELDPAVRVGARLDAKGEALLLHTTSWGHCLETADFLARALRQGGWDVAVRTFNELAPIVSNGSGPGMLAGDAAETLVATIGPAPGHEPEALVAALAPSAPRVMRKTKKTRLRCRACGHLTMGVGLRSHVKNIGHDDWEQVTVYPDGTVTPAQAQTCPPEASGSATSASG